MSDFELATNNSKEPIHINIQDIVEVEIADEYEHRLKVFITRIDNSKNNFKGIICGIYDPKSYAHIESKYLGLTIRIKAENVFGKSCQFDYRTGQIIRAIFYNFDQRLLALENPTQK